jgi:hypothetical protein
VEEVCRDDAAGLRGEELLPGRTGSARGGIDTCGLQDSPHSRWGDLVSEVGQFTLDPPMSPARVLTGQVKNELLDRRVGRWSSGGTSTCAVVPLPGDESAMPGQDRRGLDGENLVPAPSGQQRGQGGEPEAVRWLIPDSAAELATEDDVLVSEHEQFSVLTGVMAQQHSGDGQQAAGQLV